MEGLLIGHQALFFSQVARRAKESSLVPIYSGLCWSGKVGSPNVSRGLFWQLCDKGESLEGPGCPRTTNVVLPSGGWSVSFQQMFPLCKDRKWHLESCSNWVKSHVCATHVKRTRLRKRNQPLVRAMIVACWWLRFKLQRIKLSAFAFLVASVFSIGKFLLKADICQIPMG